MITLLKKHGEDDYSVWFSEISENDPLWKELMKKYCNTGSSFRGTLADITEEVRDNMQKWIGYLKKHLFGGAFLLPILKSTILRAPNGSSVCYFSLYIFLKKIEKQNLWYNNYTLKA